MVRKAVQVVLAAGDFVPTAGRAAAAVAGPVLVGHPLAAEASEVVIAPAAAVGA